MTSVAVVVPYRPGDPDRQAALGWGIHWWRTTFPAWNHIIGLEGDTTDGPWCKARAVDNGIAAATRAGADVVVIADADVYVPGVAQAVQAVEGGTAWAMPHIRVYRMGPEATRTFIAAGVLPPLQRVAPARGSRPAPGDRPIVDSHKGQMGGGCVVMPVELYNRVPLDPRFQGWGQEDTAWGRALHVTAGAAWRINEPLWHLWHTTPPRRDRAVGNQANLDLYRRYRAASTAAEIAALVAEFRPNTGA